VSGLVGALAITVLIRYVRHRSYAPFVAYRLIVGGATLVLGMLRR
jgi:undecaprenyl pyrophosphate phosphatase UppP